MITETPHLPSQPQPNPQLPLPHPHSQIILKQTSTLNQHELSKLLPPDSLQINLFQGKWQKIQKIVPQIAEWAIDKLWIFSNERSAILKEISHIGFANLVTLSASDNNIESIQALGYSWMPNLRTLLLDKNKIRSMRPLKRLKTELTHLDLSKNCIMDLEVLAKMWTGSKMDTLELEMYSGNPALAYNCRGLIKMEPRIWDKLSLPMTVRFFNLRAFEMLNKNRVKKIDKSPKIK